MSVKKITGKIIDDANKKSKEMIDGAKAKALEILKKSKEDTLSFSEETKKNAGAQNEDLLMKSENLSVLEGNKLILKTKQDNISNIHELALLKLEALSNEDYFSYMKNILSKIPITNNASLILNEKDKARISQSNISKINPLIKIAEEVGNFRAGFILSFGDIEYNCSYEELVRQIIDLNKKELAQILFG